MSGSGTYDVTLSPNATQPILAAGGYCKVISAPAGNVQLKIDSGETWTVNEGQGFRMPDGQEFTRVLVKNTAGLAQTILVLIGDASFEDSRIAGDVRVIDQVAANVQTVGMSPVTAIGTLATQMLDPTTNTKGAVIRQATLEATAGGAGTVNSRLLASPTTPVSPNGAALLALAILLVNGTVQQSLGLFDLKKRIPAGWGVWHYSIVGGAVATSNSGSLSYELQT